MIRIGILGDIGSGKSYISKSFGYPVFNADYEVSKLYKSDQKTLKDLKKVLPGYFHSLPIDKKKVLEAIFANKNNLKKIINVVHKQIRRKLRFFLIKNKKQKIVILDIPLLLENKLNNKDDVLIFVSSRKKDIMSRLKKRSNFNSKILKIFRNIQLPLEQKKNKAQFTIKNNFTKKTINLEIKNILSKIL